MPDAVFSSTKRDVLAPSSNVGALFVGVTPVLLVTARSTSACAAMPDLSCTGFVPGV